jgi:hypothetical protein
MSPSISLCLCNVTVKTPLYFFWFASFVLVLVLFLSNLALPRVYWVFQAFQRQQAYQVGCDI